VRHQIVARSAEKVQAPPGHGLAVTQHIHDPGASTLLHTAAGLVLQRGDAPGLVAGAGIFIDYLAVADKVALKRSTIWTALSKTA
jgi:hypothetical protein